MADGYQTLGTVVATAEWVFTVLLGIFSSIALVNLRLLTKVVPTEVCESEFSEYYDVGTTVCVNFLTWVQRMVIVSIVVIALSFVLTLGLLILLWRAIIDKSNVLCRVWSAISFVNLIGSISLLIFTFKTVRELSVVVPKCYIFIVVVYIFYRICCIAVIMFVGYGFYKNHKRSEFRSNVKV